MHRFLRNHLKLAAVAVSCAAAGAAAGSIASAGAATSQARSRAVRPGLLFRHLGRVVAGTLVVATPGGSFANVTVARGSVVSVSGQQLTLDEGTKTATYQRVTLTLPATTTVRDNGQSSTLAQLQQGERALVVIGPNRAFVRARTPSGG